MGVSAAQQQGIYWLQFAVKSFCLARIMVVVRGHAPGLVAVVPHRFLPLHPSNGASILNSILDHTVNSHDEQRNMFTVSDSGGVERHTVQLWYVVLVAGTVVSSV